MKDNREVIKTMTVNEVIALSQEMDGLLLDASEEESEWLGEEFEADPTY